MNSRPICPSILGRQPRFGKGSGSGCGEGRRWQAIPEATPGGSIGALVNAGLDAFVQAATLDLTRGIRLNAVCPGRVRETLVVLGMDPSAGTPAADAACAYVEAVEGTMQGQSIIPRPAS
ncbi:Rossmann-fold NAD(P)-binding domain-containing protein [Tenggerimyces flavus]|uniref:SDR family oxidoreductase n=1 Tax=Tenggerimyces flavus TaxID=1708749 RepID=A0ABV7YGS2_9ACTN|nr:hypothetical protein [Tenggerimyces flavus]MBM7784001.1 NAD(P)-dependent dehydrogenase (short-subunit alcohol dehydrogenase family) [Tenggerimyces flavus]